MAWRDALRKIMKIRRRKCRRGRVLQLLIVCGIIAIITFHHLYENAFRSKTNDDSDIYIDDLPQPSYEFPGYLDYVRILISSASEDKTVIMALVDSGYIHLAYNFYASSILRHEIENVLLVALDHAACEKFSSTFPSSLVQCFVYKEVRGADHPSISDSREFKEKVYLRRFFVLEALKLGYNVIMTDLDVIFREDPVIDIKMTCAKKMCDLAAIWDDHLEIYNTGLMYIRSTMSSINFYQRLAAYEMSHGVGQMALNAALKQNTGKQAIPLKVVPLSPRKYKVGVSLFPHNNCPDSKYYKDVLVIHNNYILEEHNKIYRFKQCLLWDWDGLDGYYTNTTRKYISVENIGPAGSITEHQTLLNAFLIGKLLDRTVILPRFQCKKKKCNLLQRIYDSGHLYFMKRFDAASQGNYRESSFLRNPRVPDSIKESVSLVYHIAYSHEHEPPKKVHHTESVHALLPRTLAHGPTEKEIIQWFGHNHASVLRMESLHGYYAHMDHHLIIGEELARIIRQL